MNTEKLNTWALQGLLTGAFISILLLLPVTSVHGGDNPGDDNRMRAAENVLNKYFNALKNGDLNTIRGLMGAKLLKRRARQLSNPVYSSQLIEHHKNMTYTITGNRPNNNQTLAVFVSSMKNDVEAGNYQFILQNIDAKGMRIIEENQLL